VSTQLTLGRTAFRISSVVSESILEANLEGFIFLCAICTHFWIHGITAFSSAVPSTAPQTVHIASSSFVGSLHSAHIEYAVVHCAHAIHHLSAVAPNHVPFTSHSHLTGTGAVSANIAPVSLAFCSCGVNHILDTPACVILAQSCFVHSAHSLSEV
jgi:hypothetical protein